MRLLRYEDDGRLTITSFDDGAIPPYAILSHTWGADAEEVTFADLARGGGKHKPGYKKIRLCGKQAQRDRLQYFWVDTCCIDKSDKAELSLAIRSMFRWYQNATKCYVYLSDLSTKNKEAGDLSTEFTWEPAFRSSRWFTRGWTLQELLAPSVVEFFSQEWERLGDKISLNSLINKTTGIPHQVLEEGTFSQFDVNERLRWKGDRKTKLREDMAYSMSGICDADIAPVYGEGEEEAFRRLHDEIRKLKDCLRDLRSSDPRDDKKRIEDTKGGLLADSYRWVLDNPAFQQWQQDPHSRLLWVKGDPGKGKTMLLCGIINELQSSMPQSALLSYFFCQATDARINSATAVLRGLLHMLVTQQPSLASHVRKKHDHAGKALFEDANAWVVLAEIFEAVLQDPSLRMTYLVVDALDECVTDLPKLLEFVAKQSSASSRVKWIVSSRNWPDIEAQLERAGHKVKLSLELNAQSIAAAVDVFIQRKVDQLAQEKRYKIEVRHAVLQHLKSNASDTFLWVALVCQDLKTTPKWNVLKKLAQFPPGLDALYKRMMDQISESDSAEICLQVLASTAILYRPVAVPELVALVEQLEDLDDLESVREIIGFCRSFLTLREDTVYFVHQSAKDFLFAKAYSEAFPAGSEAVHRTIFLRSLAILSRTLHRDMYSLEAPGYPIENVKLPEADPLAVSRYPCIYWIDHLCDLEPKSLASSVGSLQAADVVDKFLRKKYLYWLEGLSLCKSVGKGIVSIEKLQLLVQEMCDQDRLTQLVQDARRFIMYHKGAIKGYPLQTYASALLFSPTGSLVRQLFKHEEPEAISIRLTLSEKWSACLQTLEGHSDDVNSVAFSHDSTRLASASYDNTVKIWDASTGACLHTLEGHSDDVSSVVFSHDSTRLASASGDRTVKIWDASTGACLHTLEGHSSSVRSVAFSHDSTRLASASGDRTVKIWDASTGACLQTLEGHSHFVSLVAFSHDSTRLASASYDRTVKIWDASTGACLQTLEGHSSSVRSVAFSHDSTRLASASSDRTVKIWDASTGACLHTLEGHSDDVNSVAFSHDSTRLASASYDNTVKIWDASTGACLHTLEGHSDDVNSVAFSHDSTRLASASWDRTVKIWDASTGACLHTLDVGKVLFHLSFDRNSSRLLTEIGSIDTQSLETSSITDLKEPARPLHVGTGFSSDLIWIQHAGNNMLWVPSEYRPSHSSVSGTMVGVGVGSGRVWICSIDL
ncbi:Vegetative incompatibility protein [Alternaria arborescens]|nr:Vegetative incompatibility protein [Alternaria arborescens]